MPQVRFRVGQKPASQPVCWRSARAKCVPTWRVPLPCRGVKLERSCGCNQFPVGLAVKPTWAAHADQIYYYVVRERRRREHERRSREGKSRRDGEREELARETLQEWEMRLATQETVSPRGASELTQHPATNVKLSADMWVWMHAHRLLDNSDERLRGRWLAKTGYQEYRRTR